jgi:hypothetical protein
MCPFEMLHVPSPNMEYELRGELFGQAGGAIALLMLFRGLAFRFIGC